MHAMAHSTACLPAGAPKRRLLATGTALRPVNERSVDAIAFLAGPGPLKHMLLAVGGDRWLRVWDAREGHLRLERFSGHAAGETVQALALDGRNTLAATGDSAGFVKVGVRVSVYACMAGRGRGLSSASVFLLHSLGRLALLSQCRAVLMLDPSCCGTFGRVRNSVYVHASSAVYISVLVKVNQRIRTYHMVDACMVDAAHVLACW